MRLLENLRLRPRFSRNFYVFCGAFLIVGIFIVSLPTILFWEQAGRYLGLDTPSQPFPVTVDPKNKRIIENADVEALLGSQYVLLPASLGSVRGLLESLGDIIASASWYGMFASAGAPRAVVIYPGARKEQVAYAFGSTIGWDAEERAEFLSTMVHASSTLSEGHFAPGTYMVNKKTTPEYASALINTRFSDTVLSRYPESTSDVVPLSDAVIIASLIERETADKEEMRVISGIIWNRLFIGMKLQIDATLQYARGTERNAWWPPVRTRDKYIDSPYNTYLHEGLPPHPISNPSVAAIIAALNPKSTNCLFYFHDDDGEFFCTKTYEEHVKLLRTFYGRGR